MSDDDNYIHIDDVDDVFWECDGLAKVSQEFIADREFRAELIKEWIQDNSFDMWEFLDFLTDHTWIIRK